MIKELSLTKFWEQLEKSRPYLKFIIERYKLKTLGSNCFIYISKPRKLIFICLGKTNAYRHTKEARAKNQARIQN